MPSVTKSSFKAASGSYDWKFKNACVVKLHVIKSGVNNKYSDLRGDSRIPVTYVRLGEVLV